MTKTEKNIIQTDDLFFGIIIKLSKLTTQMDPFSAAKVVNFVSCLPREERLFDYTFFCLMNQFFIIFGTNNQFPSGVIVNC